jgi:RNA polymerase sigma-70 factor, ECF subfamily
VPPFKRKSWLTRQKNHPACKFSVRIFRPASLLMATMPLDQESIVRSLFCARARLSAAAWLVVRDAQAAEDIFQNVSVKALTKGMPFEHEGALLSWATVSARHEAVDWLRKRKAETLGLDSDVLDLLDHEWQSRATGPEGPRMEALRECLEAAPANARRLLELRYFEGHSCAEVALALGAEIAAVYQRLSRLHRQMRQCVEQRLTPS